MPKTEQSRKILLARNEEEHQIFYKIVHRHLARKMRVGKVMVIKENKAGRN